jgi:hypothetical protein
MAKKYTEKEIAIYTMVDYMIKHGMKTEGGKSAARNYKYNTGAPRLCLQIINDLLEFNLVKIEKFCKELKELSKNYQ